jgi:twitching motility protein PilI
MNNAGPTPAPMLLPSVALALPAVTQGAARHSESRADGGYQARQGFRVGDLALMVRYEDGSELTAMPRLVHLPNTPAWCLGMANLHGLLVPVFDLGGWIGLNTAPTGSHMLLVLSHGADAAGVAIDGLPQRLRWTPDQQADAATAPARLAPHVRGAALIEGVLWFDIDRTALLDAFEASLAGLTTTGH